jgi:2-oxoglutarate dehydrogenase E1 component
MRSKIKKGKFNVYNSLLSEYGVIWLLWVRVSKSKYTDHLGSTIWDFSNGAQIMIDQYILVVKTNGTIKTELFYCHHTVMKVKEQSTPRLEWNVIYNFAPDITCMLPIVQRQPTFFTCCEDKWKQPSVNHLWCLHQRVCCVILDVYLLEELATGSFQETIDDTTVKQM